MSSQTPPNPWFNAINYNPTFFATSTAGVSLSYVNANFLKSSAGSNPLSYATSTTFLNSVVLGNTTILQTGVNFDIRNNSVSSTMTVRLNNGASVAQTVMSLNGLGNNTSAFYGNSTTSTTASNVAVNDVSAINGSYNLLMAVGSSSSTLAVNGTSSLLYNPSTGILQTPVSTVTGNITSGGNIILSTASGTVNINTSQVGVNLNIATASAGTIYLTAGGSNGISLTSAQVTNILPTTFNNTVTLTRPITSTNTTIPVAGQIGYYLPVNTITATIPFSATVGLPASGIFININSLAIGAGIWQINAVFGVNSGTAVLTVSRYVFEVSLSNIAFQGTTSQTQNCIPFTMPAVNGNSFCACSIISTTTATTIYGNGLITFSNGGSPTISSFITATRIA